MNIRSGVLIAVWALALVCVGVSDNNYAIRTATMIAMFSTLAYSWNFIGGFAGYPSFSTAAFFGLGCYVGALAQVQGLSLPVAWLLAMIVVAAFSALIGGILLRLRGHYFAVGSIAIVELCRLVIAGMPKVTGGGSGLNVPLLRWDPGAVAVFYLDVMVAVLVLVVVTTYLVQVSRFGFGLRCINQNEDAAEMVGINTTAYKISAYVLSAVFCGLIGAAYASWTGYIDPHEAFNPLMSIKVPVMALLGGAGTLVGPALGAAVFILLEEVAWSNFLEWNNAIVGLVVVLLVFFLPHGLLRLNVMRLFGRSQATQASRG